MEDEDNNNNNSDMNEINRLLGDGNFLIDERFFNDYGPIFLDEDLMGLSLHPNDLENLSVSRRAINLNLLEEYAEEQAPQNNEPEPNRDSDQELGVEQDPEPNRDSDQDQGVEQDPEPNPEQDRGSDQYPDLSQEVIPQPELQPQPIHEPEPEPIREEPKKVIKKKEDLTIKCDIDKILKTKSELNKKNNNIALILKYIPYTILQEKPVSRKNEPDCVICLTDFEKGERVSALPCCHVFHSGCLEEWIGTGGPCPVCKYEVNLTNLIGEAYIKERRAQFEKERKEKLLKEKIEKERKEKEKQEKLAKERERLAAYMREKEEKVRKERERLRKEETDRERKIRENKEKLIKDIRERRLNANKK